MTTAPLPGFLPADALHEFQGFDGPSDIPRGTLGPSRPFRQGRQIRERQQILWLPDQGAESRPLTLVSRCVTGCCGLFRRCLVRARTAVLGALRRDEDTCPGWMGRECWRGT